MRFSRFKQTLLGIEAKPRNRTKDNKNRVTKSKKEVKGRKSKDDDSVKEDPGSQEPEETATKAGSPHVKQEMSQPLPDMTGYSSTCPTTSAPLHGPDMYSRFHSRLLTPCSDSDVLASSSSYGASPHSDMLHTDASFCHEHTGWAINNPYPTFGAPYALDSYSPGYSDQHSHLPNDHLSPQHHDHFCGGDLGVHQHTQLTSEELGVPEAVMEADGSQVTVKHEEWASSPY